MERITDPNPYEILGVGPNADRRTIKQALAERQRQSKSQAERQQALNARNTLVVTDKRLFVDALTPLFASPTQAADIRAAFAQLRGTEAAPTIDDFINGEQALAADLDAVMMATIRHTLGAAPMPQSTTKPVDGFDGLETFLESWLDQR